MRTPKDQEVRRENEVPSGDPVQAGYFPEDYIPEELDLYEQPEQGPPTDPSKPDQRPSAEPQEHDDQGRQRE